MSGVSARVRSPRWPLLAAVAALLGVLGLLGWLRGQLQETLAETRRLSLRLLDQSSLVRGGMDDLVYSDLIAAAELAVEQPLLDAVYVFKAAGGTQGKLVYPYWAELRGAATDSGSGLVRGAERHELAAPGGQATAYVWLVFDRAPLRAVDLALAVVVALLAGTLGLFAARLTRQHVRLQTTTIELEEKRAQLIQTERLALAGRLSASLLHDLRKPVQAVRALARDRLDEAAGDAPTSDDWREVVRQAELFQGMLASTRLERLARSGGGGEAGAREWCDLRDLLERSLDLVQYERGDVEVERDYAEGALLVEAEPYELIQAFSNLILNAFEAMKGRGRLALRTEARSGEFVVAIGDSGPGIAAAERERVFEPFQTSRAEQGGSGLGLYIVREIVRGLGGRVTIGESPLGGARFTVALPAPAPEATDGAI